MQLLTPIKNRGRRDEKKWGVSYAYSKEGDRKCITTRSSHLSRWGVTHFPRASTEWSAHTFLVPGLTYQEEAGANFHFNWSFNWRNWRFSILGLNFGAVLECEDSFGIVYWVYELKKHYILWDTYQYWMHTFNSSTLNTQFSMQHSFTIIKD